MVEDDTVVQPLRPMVRLATERDLEIQGQVLGLGHFDGHRLELVQEGGAAEGLAADAQPAQQLGLVPDADLPQLNAGVRADRL